MVALTSFLRSDEIGNLIGAFPLASAPAKQNRNARELQEVGEDIDEISEDIEEIGEDIDEMSEDDEEDEEHRKIQNVILGKLTKDIQRILDDLETLKHSR